MGPAHTRTKSQGDELGSGTMKWSLMQSRIRLSDAGIEIVDATGPSRVARGTPERFCCRVSCIAW
jgi:hypothetical protein